MPHTYMSPMPSSRRVVLNPLRHGMKEDLIARILWLICQGHEEDAEDLMEEFDQMFPCLACATSEGYAINILSLIDDGREEDAENLMNEFFEKFPLRMAS